jgi:hypothetical protein
MRMSMVLIARIVLWHVCACELTAQQTGHVHPQFLSEELGQTGRLLQNALTRHERSTGEETA